MLKECLSCNKEFESKIKNKKYCTEKCRKKAESTRYKPKPKEKECISCKAKYLTFHSEQKYCSRECGYTSRLRTKPPVHRPHPFKDEIEVYRRWGKLTTRLNKANSIREKRLAREHKLSVMLECRECDTAFNPRTSRQVFCSFKCSKKNDKRIQRSKRRAKIRDAQVEAVNPTLVFDRDGWKCQLCGCSTPKKYRGTYKDKAPELDHVIPLALGGEHSYDNAQCLCRLCNRTKGSDDISQGRFLL